MTCPLFVELCAGSAAVTLKLLGGRSARPPVSYMGSKTGCHRPTTSGACVRLLRC